jgi:class 3 adenylate cyclase
MPDWKTFNEAVAEVQGSKTLKIVINAKGPVHVPSPPWDPRVHRVDLVNQSPVILVLDEATGWIPARLHPPATASPETIDDTDEFQTKTTNIMFMDVAGWSSLSAPQIFDYVRKVLPKLNEHLALGSFRNTWGDAVVATFDNAKDAAEAALKIRDLFRGTYEHDGLPESLSCRIALHQGDPIVLKNAVTGHRDIFGQGVHVAARLEPIVEPGHVFCTKKFADALAENKGAAPRAIPLGTVDLAKGFGPAEVAVVLRPRDPDPNLKLREATPPKPTAPAVLPGLDLASAWTIQRAIHADFRTSTEPIARFQGSATKLELPLRILNCAPFPVKLLSVRLKWHLRGEYHSRGEGPLVSREQDLQGDDPVHDEFQLLQPGGVQDLLVRIDAGRFRGASVPSHMFIGSGGEVVASADPWGGSKKVNIGSQLWGSVLDERPVHES